MSYTQGPWEVLPKEEGKPYLRVRGAMLGRRYKIADVLIPIYEGNALEVQESEANALLISAAPELLDACLAADWNSLDLPEYVREKITAAIHKATRGETL